MKTTNFLFKIFSTLMIFNASLLSNDSLPLEIPHIIHNTPFILQLMSKYLPKNPVIIDAGACDGTDSLIMANLWPQGTIYAFEPVPESYQIILNRIKNTSNIFAFEYALGDKNGTADFYPSALTGQPCFDASSLLPPTDKMKNYFPQLIFNTKIQVPVITLDTWCEQNNIDHIDMLWLDMQGYELNMILASPKILKTVKAIYIEVEFVDIYKGQYLEKDIITSLTDLGFIILAKDYKESEKSFRSFGNIVFIKK